MDGQWLGCDSKEAVPLLRWSHVVGTFDPTAAATVAAKLRHIEIGTRVVLDFTRARDVSPAALWILAAGIASHSRIVLRGLCHHERRLLEYLGVRSTDENLE